MTPALFQKIRHLSLTDKKSLSQKTLKIGEEFGELARIVLPYDNAYATTHRFVPIEAMLEEVVDIVLCALSVGYDLGFDDTEIASKMVTKTEKWELLQTKERNVTYPLPYEIHITVHVPDDAEASFFDDFRATCSLLNVKPIILDLQGSSGGTAMTDVMTSCKHKGNNQSAYLAATKLATMLSAAGHDVVRIKIETVPWHPAAPIDNQPMPANCYFEAHIPVVVTADVIPFLRADINQLKRNGLKVHASQNLFKQNVEGTSILMVTLRDSAVNLSTFELMLDKVLSCLKDRYTVNPHHIEFSIYDTKISHDSTWITAT